MSEWQETSIGRIPAHWQIKSLKALIAFTVDNRGKTAPTEDKGIPLIATNCISNNDLYPVYENIRYVSQETYNNWFRSHPEPGDILLTLKGNQNGAVCLVPDPVDFVIAQDMVALRTDDKIVDPLFLFAALRSSVAQHQIKSLDVSGVIPHFKKSDFDKLMLPYPDSYTQKEIGKIYFNLCRKIDLLRRQVRTLEQIAQTLFNRWFVEFEFPDKQGQPYKSSGGAMVESELGGIPLGWRVGALGDYVNVTNGYSYQGTELQPSNVVLVTLKNFDRTGGFKMDGFKGLASTNYKKQHVVFPGDLVVAHTDLTQDAEVLGNPAIIQSVSEYQEYVISMDLVKVEPSKSFIKKPFLYYLMKNRAFKYHCIGYANGTTVLHLSKKAIPEYLFPMPHDIEILQRFNRIADANMKKITNNTRQIQTLTRLRDTLLPKLMSGQLRVAP